MIKSLCQKKNYNNRHQTDFDQSLRLSWARKIKFYKRPIGVNGQLIVDSIATNMKQNE